MLGLQLKFGARLRRRRRRRRRAVAPPSFMVFFDWDRSNLSQQALTTIQQAAGAFKTKGNARITATGHTDTSGPESLQHGAVAASCQRGQGRAGA